jgi:hypothetical protein
MYRWVEDDLTVHELAHEEKKGGHDKGFSPQTVHHPARPSYQYGLTCGCA